MVDAFSAGSALKTNTVRRLRANFAATASSPLRPRDRRDDASAPNASVPLPSARAAESDDARERRVTLANFAVSHFRAKLDARGRVRRILGRWRKGSALGTFQAWREFAQGRRHARDAVAFADETLSPILATRPRARTETQLETIRAFLAERDERFSDLPRREALELCRRASEVSFEEGDVVRAAGEDDDVVFACIVGAASDWMEEEEEQTITEDADEGGPKDEDVDEGGPKDEAAAKTEANDDPAEANDDPAEASSAPVSAPASARPADPRPIRTHVPGARCFGEPPSSRAGPRAWTTVADASSRFLALSPEDCAGTSWERPELTRRKRVDLLCRLPCFDACTLAELVAIAAHLDLREFEPGAALANQGQECPGVFLILAGDVAVERRVDLDAARAAEAAKTAKAAREASGDAPKALDAIFRDDAQRDAYVDFVASRAGAARSRGATIRDVRLRVVGPFGVVGGADCLDRSPASCFLVASGSKPVRALHLSHANFRHLVVGAAASHFFARCCATPTDHDIRETIRARDDAAAAAAKARVAATPEGFHPRKFEPPRADRETARAIAAARAEEAFDRTLAHRGVASAAVASDAHTADALLERANATNRTEMHPRGDGADDDVAADDVAADDVAADDVAADFASSASISASNSASISASNSVSISASISASNAVSDPGEDRAPVLASFVPCSVDVRRAEIGRRDAAGYASARARGGDAAWPLQRGVYRPATTTAVGGVRASGGGYAPSSAMARETKRRIASSNLREALFGVGGEVPPPPTRVGVAEALRAATRRRDERSRKYARFLRDVAEKNAGESARTGTGYGAGTGNETADAGARAAEARRAAASFAEATHAERLRIVDALRDANAALLRARRDGERRRRGDASNVSGSNVSHSSVDAWLGLLPAPSPVDAHAPARLVDLSDGSVFTRPPPGRGRAASGMARDAGKRDDADERATTSSSARFVGATTASDRRAGRGDAAAADGFFCERRDDVVVAVARLVAHDRAPWELRDELCGVAAEAAAGTRGDLIRFARWSGDALFFCATRENPDEDPARSAKRRRRAMVNLATRLRAFVRTWHENKTKSYARPPPGGWLDPRENAMEPAGDLAVGVAAGAAFLDAAAGGALRAVDGAPRDAAARLCDLAAESGGGVRVDPTVRDACRKTHQLVGGAKEAAFGGYRLEDTANGDRDARGGGDGEANANANANADGDESEEENAVARVPASVPVVRGRDRFGTRRGTVGCRRTARAPGGAAREALETFRRTPPREATNGTRKR